MGVAPGPFELHSTFPMGQQLATESQPPVSLAGKTSQSTAMQLLCFTGAAASLLLYLPLVLYATNLDDVDISKQIIVSIGLLVSGVAIFGLFLLGRVPKLSAPVELLSQLIVLVVFALILFPNQTGEITGFEEGVPGSANVLPFLKMILFLGLAVLVRLRYPAQLESAASAISALLVLACIALPLLLTSSSDRSINPDGNTRRSFVELGSESNIVVLLLDGFTGYRMSEVLKERPECPLR